MLNWNMCQPTNVGTPWTVFFRTTFFFFLNWLFNLVDTLFLYSVAFCSLKAEIEKLQADHNEDVAQRQHKYKLEINSLKDQLLESDARRESLEREVTFIRIVMD